MTRQSVVSTLFCSLFWFWTIPAGAQIQKIIGEHDFESRLDCSADRMELRGKDQRASAYGSVICRQKGARLSSDRAELHYTVANPDGGSGSESRLSLLRIDMQGQVQLTLDALSARGDYGIYDLETRQVTMIGNVVLKRKESQLRGHRLRIDLDSKITSFDGKIPRKKTKGRVRGIFTVPVKDRKNR